MNVQDRSHWPAWVRIGLWGINSRMAVWLFIAISFALAVGSCLYANTRNKPYFYWGSIFVLSGVWYYLALRWVEQNGGRLD